MKLEAKGKTILIIGAHPDDVEFGAGATVAKLVSEGAKAYFVVCTDGNRGSRQTKISKVDLVANRANEQKEAAKILGASDIFMLPHEDGNLMADITFKEEVVKIIRKLKPDMIFTHDPSWFYRVEGAKGTSSINHNDHRETGIAVLDAVYPLSRDLLSFPEHIEEGLEPHKVPEVYLFNFYNPNFLIDVTEFIQKKIESINAHKSQIDDPKETEKWVLGMAKKLGKKIKVKYAEGFTRLVLR